MTGVKDEYNHFEYIDNRTELEKQPTAFKVATIDTANITESYCVINDEVKAKKWWRFW